MRNEKKFRLGTTDGTEEVVNDPPNSSFCLHFHERSASVVESFHQTRTSFSPIEGRDLCDIGSTTISF